MRAPSEHILERDHELAGKLVHGDAEEHVRAGRRQVDLDPVQGGVLGDRVGVGQRGDEAVQLGRRETWVPDSQRRAEADDDRDLILRYLAAPHHLGAGDMRIAAVAMGDASFPTSKETRDPEKAEASTAACETRVQSVEPAVR